MLLNVFFLEESLTVKYFQISVLSCTRADEVFGNEINNIYSQ